MSRGSSVTTAALQAQEIVYAKHRTCSVMLFREWKLTVWGVDGIRKGGGERAWSHCTRTKFEFFKREQHFYFYSREMLRKLYNEQKQKE